MPQVAKVMAMSARNTCATRLCFWKKSNIRRTYDPGWCSGWALRKGRNCTTNHARCDQGREFVDRHRPGKEVALGLLASVPAQERRLGRGLDAFGDHRESERVRHLDDRPH